MRTKILMTLLVTNLLLALYGLGRFDGLLAPAYQRTTYLNGQGQAPLIAAPPTAAPKMTPQKTATLPTAPITPAVVAPATTASAATAAPAANRTTNAATNSTPKTNVKANPSPTPPTATAVAPTQKTTTTNNSNKKTNRSTQVASTNYEEPVYEPIRIAPQPAPASPPVRTESPVTSSGTLQRHQVNKNIAAMCQNASGAWLPCR